MEAKSKVVGYSNWLCVVYGREGRKGFYRGGGRRAGAQGGGRSPMCWPLSHSDFCGIILASCLSKGKEWLVGLAGGNEKVSGGEWKWMK